MFWQSLESDGSSSAAAGELPVTVHRPVLVREVLHYLGCRPGQNHLDLTVGGGGHADAILRAAGPDGKLAGADRDIDALKRAGERLRPFGERVKLLYGSLARADETLAAAALSPLHGVLIDCGLSSDQLEDPQRGFSFVHSGPLDMRMDTTRGATAGEWLSRVDERELADVLFRYGEERHSRRIAKGIVEARKWGPLETTQDLEEAVLRSLPRRPPPRRIHPATRTFQAVRIAVNDELNELRIGLDRLLNDLPHGCRLVVISFHSLEDRIVKQMFRAAALRGRGRPLTKKPVVPADGERAANPRCRSAKLRALEIVGGTG
jgi:16S rRNA (cytosine1402-N4)-methyltransferase